RFLVVVSAISFLLPVPAFAGDLQIKVIDPNSAAVAGAQVSIYRGDESAPIQVRTTSGAGVATFDVDSSPSLRVEVLAPGFARAQNKLESPYLTVRLQIASASETVVVTSTRSPVPEQETASSVSVLAPDELTTMQPLYLGDALRFL